MNNLVNKIGTVFFWLLAVYIWWQGYQDVLAWIPKIALAVAGIHLLEVAFFWFALRAKSTSPRLDALQIFVFGIFHLQRFMGKAAKA